MTRLATALLAVLAIGACSKHSDSKTPQNVSYGSTHTAPEDRSPFQKAWNAFLEGGDMIVDAGEWTFEKVEDGAVVVGRGAKKVAGKVGEETNDAAIVTSLKSRLAAAENVDAMKIDVDVDEGMCILRGDVHSRAEAAKAIQIALDTRGCAQVKSYLTFH